MITRTLGANGPEVSAIGFGCHGLNHSYGTGLDDQAAITLLHSVGTYVYV